MKDTILRTLKQLEKDYEIKILFACEAGSRAWGLASSDSDYDVRFIYVHPTSYYLSIDPVINKRDVIEKTVNKQLDITGWELTKALRLFRKSNPSLLEWLHSDIIYYQAFSAIDYVNELQPIYFNAKACILHYLNMTKTNMKKIDQQKNIKLYLNMVRPVLAARWINNYEQFPPVKFHTLVHTLIPNSSLRDAIHLLAHNKITKNKVIDHIDMDRILTYINLEWQQLHKEVTSVEKKSVNRTEDLNQLFRNVLKEVWG
ncbi:nucleotidyltransferase domain-containing protein [Ornithinibacillus sp. L9]|uniref:Nucleotidyltransferase domain-containing protein n=1 Tax=Ornithinibacillus caprae TaxID=2678566 RepID=A0A6N8FF03_9BACI|nr:nucleotidyltransferase domain-containing protein [Ornithinibacillus caprae]MUK88015.1 nucleotidyltransferase domain-containing protein [Ornithinibacillus caprae]